MNSSIGIGSFSYIYFKKILGLLLRVILSQLLNFMTYITCYFKNHEEEEIHLKFIIFLWIYPNPSVVNSLDYPDE